MADLSAPFVRDFGPGAVGPDVLAVKRALVKAGFGKGILLTETFGVYAQAELAVFKKRHGLLDDPVYTPQAQQALERFFDAHDVALLNEEKGALEREAFCKVAAATVAHVGLFDYTMNLGDGPGERGWWRGMPDATNWKVTTRRSCDCSQHWIGCGRHAGLTNPIFQTDAATGEILDLDRTTAAAAKPGDGVVFTGPDWEAGHHITTLYKKLPSGDWQNVNMGEQGQPIFGTLSAEAAAQAAMGAPDLVYVELPL